MRGTSGTYSGKVRSTGPALAMTLRNVNADCQPLFFLAMQSPLKVETRRLFSGTTCMN